MCFSLPHPANLQDDDRRPAGWLQRCDYLAHARPWQQANLPATVENREAYPKTASLEETSPATTARAWRSSSRAGFQRSSGFTSLSEGLCESVFPDSRADSPALVCSEARRAGAFGGGSCWRDERANSVSPRSEHPEVF